MTQMEKEYFGAAVFQDCELSSLMLHFFAIIGRKLHQNAPHENISSLRQKEQQERFSMLCNYINAHCTEDLSLDELANEAGFSKYHFARLFTQARACDHCVILRRIKFNRRIRIKSRRMVSVMKVKFDRHKGRVFFTGEFYQETASVSCSSTQAIFRIVSTPLVRREILPLPPSVPCSPEKYMLKTAALSGASLTTLTPML